MMRKLLQAVLYLCLSTTLAALLTIPRAANGQSKRLFSEPQSILLFGDWNHFVSTPTGIFEIPSPPDSLPEMGFPLPALALTGDQFATSFSFPDGFGYGGCDPTRHTCAKITPKHKSVMGVYSLRDEAWKFYGDFCLVGSAAFSPDGRKVAFMGKVRSGNPDCGYVYGSEMLMILDLETGQFMPVPDTGAMPENGQLSWAPDGRRLAVELKGKIVSIEIGSWAQKVIAEGTDPSWSPKGDWIAYQVQWNRICMLIHPDGTGAKMALDLRRRSGGWLFYDGTVWSPDGDRLLLNEEQYDGPNSEVEMVDLTTGRITTRSRKAFPVFGWVAEIN